VRSTGLGSNTAAHSAEARQRSERLFGHPGCLATGSQCALCAAGGGGAGDRRRVVKRLRARWGPRKSCAPRTNGDRANRRVGMVERPPVPLKPDNAGGREGPQFETDAMNDARDWAAYKLQEGFRTRSWRRTAKRRREVLSDRMRKISSSGSMIGMCKRSDGRTAKADERVETDMSDAQPPRHTSILTHFVKTRGEEIFAVAICASRTRARCRQRRFAPTRRWPVAHP
jgi:hypothetical protein